MPITYPHDPVVQDTSGFIISHVGVGDGIGDVVSCTLVGAACTVQPARTDILQLPSLQD